MTAARGRRGQSTLEFCMGFVIVLLALVGMFLVIKGAISGRWRSVGDTLGQGMQYEPGVTR